MSNTPLKIAIRALDLLDGKRDNKYFQTPLIKKNITGACLSGNSSMKNFVGKKIDIDCKKTALKLLKLSKIFKKLPAARFIAKHPNSEKQKTAAYQKELRSLGADDFFGFHVVHHMIEGMLLGIYDTKGSFNTIFSKIPFLSVSNIVQGLGYRNFRAANAKRASHIFNKLARRYSFDSTPFLNKL
ncbi:MAG: hypothetical protein ABIE74_11625 [Pseudomonadota bacterium]